jgi:hypothetical protein
MITDISPYVIYELGMLKGQHVRLCRYRFNGSGYNEGYVLVGENSSFFIRCKANVVEDKHDIHFLVIKAFQNIELDDSFSYDTQFEGTLNGIQILKSTTKGMIVQRKVVQDIITENALLADFEGDKRLLIYPHTKLYSDTSISANTDEILDLISARRFQTSRIAKQDVNLLLTQG